MPKRLIKYTIILVVAIITCCFLYIRFGGYFFIEKEYREFIVKEINDAPELPERFYELYELTYPNSLSKGVFSNLIERNIFDNHNSESPTLSISAMLAFGTDQYLLAFYLEDQTTQIQCVNLEAVRTNFLYGNIGIDNASKFYFQKDLKDLDDKEFLTFIIMIRNPSLYDPVRRPEKVKERVNSILERLGNKKNSRTLMQLFNVL